MRNLIFCVDEPDVAAGASTWADGVDSTGAAAAGATGALGGRFDGDDAFFSTTFFTLGFSASIWHLAMSIPWLFEILHEYSPSSANSNPFILNIASVSVALKLIFDFGYICFLFLDWKIKKLLNIQFIFCCFYKKKFFYFSIFQPNYVRCWLATERSSQRYYFTFGCNNMIFKFFSKSWCLCFWSF